MGIIELKDVIKKYNRKFKALTIKALEKEPENVTIALKGVNLSIEKGEFVVIMGPSGAGKSTLLNMIATLDTPTKGKVLIEGNNIKNMLEDEVSKFRYDKMGFIFQSFNLLNSLTVKENIILTLALADVPVEEINKKVDYISKKLDILNILNKYPNECSGGQVQRVAAARALINNPEIIIADEPTGNLDTKNSHQLLNILRDLNEKEGKTIVMVTHDAMIASYGKRLVYVRDGGIETELFKEEKSQDEFFYEIIGYVSKESGELFEKISK